MKRVEYIPEQVILVTPPSNPAAGYGKVYPKTDGKLHYLDSGGVEFDVFLGKAVGLTSAFPNSTVTRNIVTGWTFPVVATRRYKVEVIATFQTSVAGTGGTMSVNLSGGGVGTIVGSMQADIAQAAVATALRVPIRAIGVDGLVGSLMTSSGVNPINSPHSWDFTGIFTCTTSGTFEIRWASEVAASATQLNIGSTLIYTII